MEGICQLSVSSPAISKWGDLKSKIEAKNLLEKKVVDNFKEKR